MASSLEQPDRLFFHSKSARAPPGKGVHERTSKAYPTLEAAPHWREVLSNFWVAPFIYTDGLLYRSVEHCFQAQKLRIPYGPQRSAGPAIPFEQTPGYQLTLNSGSELGTGDGLAARKQRKAVLLTKAELQAWDAEKDGVMEAAQMAKFWQNPALGAVLLGTGEAELWHGAARQPPARMLCLERVRAALRTALAKSEA